MFPVGSNAQAASAWAEWAKGGALLPLFEVGIKDSAGESFPANSDPFQHAIAPQLVQHQLVFHGT